MDDPEQKEILMHEQDKARWEMPPPQEDGRPGNLPPFYERPTASSDLILQMISVGITLCNPQAEVIYSNDAAAQLLGVPQSEMTGKTFAALCPDVLREDGSVFPPEMHPVAQVLQTGCAAEKMVMGLRPPGQREYRWLQADAEPIFDPQHNVTCVVSNFTDVSEQVRAERERCDSEERYRVLFENSPLPTWVYDRETQLFLAVNDAAVTQYGYARDEFLAMHICALRPAEDVEAFLDYLSRNLPDTDGPVIWKHLRKNGSALDVRVTSQAVRFKGREARLVIAENLIDNRQAERNVRKLTKRISNILESIRDGFVTLDKQWQFTYLNSRAEQIMGERRGPLLGKNHWEVFPELLQTPIYKEYHRAVAKQNPVEFEHYFPNWDVWLRLNVYPSQDGLSIYMADVTDRKRVEAELHQTIGTLKRSVGGIVRAMSFAVELRDPYTAGHQKRVSQLVCAMARQMGFGVEEVERFRVAALLHDIGKIAMPAEILSKPGHLSVPEMSIIQGHAQLGYDILKGIDFAPQIALVALQHHERLDGSGYPNGLSGDNIIPEARMMAVADVVEAMASHRPFRPSLGIEKALNEVMINKGVLYDVAAVDSCLAVFAQHSFDFEHLLRTEEEAAPGAD